MNSQSSRRRFLKLSLAGVVGITVGGNRLIKPAYSSELEKLTEDSPQAAALRYVHDSPHSDKKCVNCALIQGSQDDEWRPCAIFPGKLVSANGWCSAWAKKP